MFEVVLSSQKEYPPLVGHGHAGLASDQECSVPPTPPLQVNALLVLPSVNPGDA